MNTKEEGKKYPKDHRYMIRLDKEWNGTLKDKDGNIIYTYENGVEIQRSPQNQPHHLL